MLIVVKINGYESVNQSSTCRDVVSVSRSMIFGGES